MLVAKNASPLAKLSDPSLPCADTTVTPVATYHVHGNLVGGGAPLNNFKI